MDASPDRPTRHVQSEQRRIVVGIDDDAPHAAGALEWAAYQAATRNALLRVVRLRALRRVARVGAGSHGAVAVDRAVNAVRQRWPTMSIETVTTRAATSDAMHLEAIGADLLVVAVLDTVAAARGLSGSVRTLPRRRGPCPVVVVRDTAPVPIRRIVVGIDNSNAATTALEWSIDEAGIHRADLLIVHAFDASARPSRSVRAEALDRADAHCVVRLAVRHCELHGSGPVSGLVVEGNAGPALLAACRGADLVVVGSRGRSGFTTLQYGSVTSLIAAGAPCPVVVIHPRVRVSRL